MNISIQSVGFVADAKLEAFIQSKINKLLKRSEDIIGVEVFLRVEKATVVENKIVEIGLKIKGAELFAKKQSESFEEATDLVVDALRRQVEKHKEKLRSK